MIRYIIIFVIAFMLGSAGARYVAAPLKEREAAGSNACGYIMAMWLTPSWRGQLNESAQHDLREVFRICRPFNAAPEEAYK
jgi:hypothetical protein